MSSPFFILGTGRCGSTYLLRLLEEHPQIALTNEARILDFVWFATEYAAVPAYTKQAFATNTEFELRGLIGDAYREDFCAVFAPCVKQAVEDFYARHFAAKEFTRWGDKLPNPRAALAARSLWPDTSYVVLVRDPRDVFCSYRSFRESPVGMTVREHIDDWFDLSVEQFCTEFRSRYGYGLPYVPDYVLVRYEDLVADPRAQLQRVLDHLELPLQSLTAKDLAQGTLFAAHGTSNSVAASVGRWRRDLPHDEGEFLTRELGDLLTGFGYDL